MDAVKVGLIGFGTLGQAFAEHIAHLAPAVTIIGAVELREPIAPPDFLLTKNIADILGLQPDVVVECAGQQALKAYGLGVVERGFDLVPASVGSLADDCFREALLSAAAHSGAMIRLPSGAMVGIDGLAAARHSGIDEVLYQGTVSPHSLKSVDQETYHVEVKTIVFQGSAREAVQKYPKNANLTATLALAGIGFDQTRVEMIVDPAIENNRHELYVRGKFGAFHVTVHGQIIGGASPTSRIVAGSLVQAALKSNYTLLAPPPVQPS